MGGFDPGGRAPERVAVLLSGGGLRAAGREVRRVELRLYGGPPVITSYVETDAGAAELEYLRGGDLDGEAALLSGHLGLAALVERSALHAAGARV